MLPPLTRAELCACVSALEIREVWDHPTTAPNDHVVLLFKSTVLPKGLQGKCVVITPISQMTD